MGAHVDNVVMEPLSALFASDAAEVPSVVACHVLQNIMHFLSGNLRKKRHHEVLV